MSLPRLADDYIHRAGRTGRFHRFGRVITLTNQRKEDFAVQRVLNRIDATGHWRRVTISSVADS